MDDNGVLQVSSLQTSVLWTTMLSIAFILALAFISISLIINLGEKELWFTKYLTTAGTLAYCVSVGSFLWLGAEISLQVRTVGQRYVLFQSDGYSFYLDPDLGLVFWAMLITLSLLAYLPFIKNKQSTPRVSREKTTYARQSVPRT